MIRSATRADCTRISAIWNPLIRETLVTFSTAERSPEALEAMLAEKAAEGRAFLVAEDDGQIAGFATYGQFRAGPGYAHSMEHTIILAEKSRGRGIGRALMSAIEDHARTGGAHSLIAGVSEGNPAGRAFHAALGYREVAVVPEVGRKFGQWFDLVLMQKIL